VHASVQRRTICGTLPSNAKGKEAPCNCSGNENNRSEKCTHYLQVTEFEHNTYHARKKGGTKSSNNLIINGKLYKKLQKEWIECVKSSVMHSCSPFHPDKNTDKNDVRSCVVALAQQSA
jgi:hypothetical protein